jgi:hypothetical protein
MKAETILTTMIGKFRTNCDESMDLNPAYFVLLLASSLYFGKHLTADG